jgi:hypothetical protein
VTLGAAAARLLAAALLIAVVSHATDLPRPWGTVGWVATAACAAWALACLARVDRLARGRR